jgi:hypothetical protein
MATQPGLPAQNGVYGFGRGEEGGGCESRRRAGRSQEPGGARELIAGADGTLYLC